MTAITPSQASEQLKIQPSTLRKYSLLLEENGIQFKRNANNSRKYSDTDITALQKMITLIKTDGVTVEDAAVTIAKWYNGDSFITDDNGDTNNGVERHGGDIAAVLIKEIRELKEKIQEQEEAIENFRVRQEMRDASFIQVMKELHDEIRVINERKALPEPQPVEEEVSEEAAPEEKRGFFARIFRK